MKVILLLISCVALLSTTTKTSANTPGEIQVGQYLHDATLQDFSGDTRKISELHGKPMIINVWASWCGPCRQEMAAINRLALRYNGKEFNVIGISTDDDANAARAFIHESKLTFTNYLDSKVMMENMLGANTIPLTILVDAHGRILKKVRGAQEWDSQESIQMIGSTFKIKLKSQ